MMVATRDIGRPAPILAEGSSAEFAGEPGTRETDLLDPVNSVDRVHAVVLAGGSAFGLDAAGGVMQYLQERSIGFQTQAAKVPIVPAAILYDLSLGRADVWPDAAMGYRAATAASSKAPAEGNVGAGTGASVGKIRGMKYAMKAGIGTSSMEVDGLLIGALVAVNAVGDVVDPNTGQMIAGLQSGTTLEWMKRNKPQRPVPSNTVIGVIATNALLTKAQATKVAQMAHDGLARAVQPAHTPFDGDTIFALATGQKQAEVSMVGAFAAEVTSQAILRAVQAARPAGGLPGLKQS
jgi:L-aminopeptidase/D-esterase-like protein